MPPRAASNIDKNDWLIIALELMCPTAKKKIHNYTTKYNATAALGFAGVLTLNREKN